MSFGNIFQQDWIKQRWKVALSNASGRDSFRVSTVAHIVVSQHYRLCGVFLKHRIDIFPTHCFFKAERQHFNLNITPSQNGCHFATQHLGIAACDYQVLSTTIEFADPQIPVGEILDFIKQHEIIAGIYIIKCRHHQILIPLFKQLAVIEIEISEIFALKHKQGKDRFAHTTRSGYKFDKRILQQFVSVILGMPLLVGAWHKFITFCPLIEYRCFHRNLF